jgi:hypothetical protein
MNESRQFPEFSRLSIISAVIILAYSLVPFVQIPTQSIAIRLPWAVFDLDFDFGTVVSILVAILAAFGADWLIQSHPNRDRYTLVRHGLIPAFTAWVIGVPLSLLEVGIEWWVVVSLGGVFLAFVLVAEYLVVDTKSTSHLPASLGLTAIAFALFLVLAIALQSSGVRLFLLLPTLTITLFFLVSRSLFLRTGGDWSWYWSAGIALFVGQLTLGLHYLPIQPLTFGLLVVGIAYPLTLFVALLKENRKGFSLFVEPLSLFFILFLLAIFTNG